METKEDLKLRYVELLSEKYPTIAAAATEIINLQAILSLPKGTEHALSDIHGEAEQFFHVLKNGSGAVRSKIDDAFGNELSIRDKKVLATLIYYPEQKLNLMLKDEPNPEDMYKTIFSRLIRVCQHCQTKYTRSKVRKAMPEDFRYIMEELIYEQADIANKEAYYNEIVNTIIRIGRAREFVVAMCNLIQRLVIDHLHIVGDIFDRGPGAPAIMDRLMNYHSVDIQWGNHDILWMAAAAGHPVSIATVIRISARYGNLDTLEDEYGINFMPLARLAQTYYADDPCSLFNIHHVERESTGVGQVEERLNEKMHKAISIIQFKLEGQLIASRPEFGMDDRRLLHRIDFEKGTITLYGKEYKLLDTNFPTIDPKDPYKLNEEEELVMEKLIHSIKSCEKLQKHIAFMFNHGSLYLCYNDILYYHGCIPMNPDGSFKELSLYGKSYSGKSLCDYLESWARRGFYAAEGTPEKDLGRDLMWYTWTGSRSPLFGKDRMTTFERYFVGEKETHEEHKDPYYKLYEDEEICSKILTEFGMNPEISHIVNGHVPVKTKKGEKPIKGNGKLLVIDGGFSKAYQPTTGIAGYTLIYNSYGLKLVTLEPFESVEKAVRDETDIRSDTRLVARTEKRKRVADTNRGRELARDKQHLEELLAAYRSGLIREKR